MREEILRNYPNGFECDGSDQAVLEATVSDMHKQFHLGCEIAELYAGRAAINIRSLGHGIATSLERPPRHRRAGVDTTLDSASLARFLIDDLPVPAQRVPWKEILAFKDDPDSQERIRSLRGWVAATARGGISIADASDRVQDALARYREHVRGAGIAHDLGMWETFVRSGIVSSSIGFEAWRASNATKPFDLTLMSGGGVEAERSAPGRELSYLVKIANAGL